MDEARTPHTPATPGTPVAPVDRRRFLKLGGSIAAVGALGAACTSGAAAQNEPTAPALGKWERVRASFDLDPDYAQFGGFLFASHRRGRQRARHHPCAGVTP